MIMWIGFKRIIRSGFVGFWRNAFVSLAAIFVMTVTLFVVCSVILLDTLLSTSLQQIQNKVDINVYFVTKAKEVDIFALQTKLETLPEVAEVTYTPRASALEQFKKRHQNSKTITDALEELGDNPLGASLSIKAKNTSQYEDIDKFLAAEQTARVDSKALIDRINFFENKIAIDKLTAIIAAIEKSSLVAMTILVLATILITFNTIRLAIYTTREEIGVMRLVGAGNMFIRGPFMFQGTLYGLVAGILALLIVYPVVLYLGPITETFFKFNLFNYYISNFSDIFITVVGLGVALGTVSSLLAVARYLRV